MGQGVGAQNGYGGYPTKGVGGCLNSVPILFSSFLIFLHFQNHAKLIPGFGAAAGAATKGWMKGKFDKSLFMKENLVSS